MGHTYAWVRVGNGDPEPAAITGEFPNRKATTLGCPDTFDVDSPLSGCSIVWTASSYQTDPRFGQAEEAIIDPFEEECQTHNRKEVTKLDAAKRERAYQRAIKTQPHSYAGFGRRMSRDFGEGR